MAITSDRRPHLPRSNSLPKCAGRTRRPRLRRTQSRIHSRAASCRERALCIEKDVSAYSVPGPDAPGKWESTTEEGGEGWEGGSGFDFGFDEDLSERCLGGLERAVLVVFPGRVLNGCCGAGPYCYDFGEFGRLY